MAPNTSEINDAISSIYQYHDNLNKDNDELAFEILDSFKIIEKTTEILKKEPAVLQIDTKKSESDFVVCGDIHGSLESLLKIFEVKGFPNLTQYLFLGDYVDRGHNSCEVIILLYSYKCLYPNNIHLIRGNHEFRDITDCYGFKDECYQRSKIRSDGIRFYNLITESFKHLPICAILNKSIFCVHGGITSLLNNRQELLSIEKVGISIDSKSLIQTEFLWNDPSEETLMYSESQRGIGSVFGQDAVDSFLKKMEFDLIIRGHQRKSDGYDWPFGELGGILTVFSSINYCGWPNKGGLAVISEQSNDYDDLVEVLQIKFTSKANLFFKNLMKLIILLCLIMAFT